MKKVLFIVHSSILLLLLTQVGFLHAQSLKVGKNLFDIKASAVLELEDSNRALLLTRVANPATSVVAPWRGMIVFDSTRNELAYYNGTTWSYPGTKTGIDSNIYNTNGSLTGARTVTMAANNLIFNSTNGNFIYNPTGTGKMGIGNSNPTQKLTIGNPAGSVSSSTTPDAITLGNTYSSVAGSNLKLRIVEANSQVWGFGVSSGQMDYVVPSSGGHAFYVNGNVATPAMKIASNGTVSITNTANASGTGINITANNLTSNSLGFTGVNVSSTAKWQTTLITGSNVNGSNTVSYDLSILGTGQGFGKLGIYNGKSRSFGFIMDTTNFIGISVSNPISRLHVSGAVRADSLVLTRVTDGASTDNILTINTATGVVRRIAANTIRPSVDTNIYSRDGSLTGNRTVTMVNNNLTFNSTNGNFIYNPTGTGKMGIGTAAPYTNLDVVGDIYMTNHRNNSLHDASERGTRKIGQKAGNTSDGFNGLELSVDSVETSTRFNEGNIKFITWRGGIKESREVARINGMGNMGIGTATPVSRLQVMGILTTDSLVLLKLPNGSSGDSILTINNGVVKRIAATTIRPTVDTNIYSRDGSLTGNRTVTMANSNLTFTNTGGIVKVTNTATTSGTGIDITANNITTGGSGFVGVNVSSTAKWQTTLLKGSNVNGADTASYDFNIMGTEQGFGKLGIYNGRAGYAFVIDTTNKIGINTSNPISRLHVLGAVRADSLVLTGLQSGTNTDNILVIDNNNNVKKISAVTSTNIYTADGTLGDNRTVTMDNRNLTFTNTGGAVKVNNTANTNGSIGIDIAANSITTSTNGFTGVNVSSTAPWQTTLLKGSNVNGANTASYELSIMGSEQGFGKLGIYNGKGGGFGFVMDSTNKIGINTKDPISRLHVSGGAVRADSLVLTSLQDGTSSDRILVIDNNNNVKKISAVTNTNIYTANGTLSSARTVTMGGNHLVFNSSGGNLIYTGSGKVGIGTTNPIELLDIQKSGADNYIRIQAGATNTNNSGILLTEQGTDYGWRIRHDAASDNLYIEAVTNSTTVSQTPLFFQRNTGYIGIKNNSPSYELDVSGNMRVSGVISTTRVQGVSDERLKKDISPIQDALSIVLKMRGVMYNWRKDMEKEVGYTFKDGRDYGVIAQEIQKVLPELVAKDAKGYLTVDYPHITPVLIEAIKEQQQEIESLKIELLKVKQLEDRSQAQEKEILELKKLVQQLIPKK